MTSTLPWPNRLRQQWFWPVAAALVLADVLVVKRLSAGAQPWLVEAGLLTDWCIVAPLLYLVCFRHRGRSAILRAVGLGCLGFYVAGHLLPAREGGLIDLLAPLRYLCLGVLLFIEIRVMIAVYRKIFSGSSAAGASDHVREQLGLPAWAARLMVIEALFWRRVVSALKRWTTRE